MFDFFNISYAICISLILMSIVINKFKTEISKQLSDHDNVKSRHSKNIKSCEISNVDNKKIKKLENQVINLEATIKKISDENNKLILQITKLLDVLKIVNAKYQKLKLSENSPTHNSVHNSVQNYSDSSNFSSHNENKTDSEACENYVSKKSDSLDCTNSNCQCKIINGKCLCGSSCEC